MSILFNNVYEKIEDPRVFYKRTDANNNEYLDQYPSLILTEYGELKHASTVESYSFDNVVSIAGDALEGAFFRDDNIINITFPDLTTMARYSVANLADGSSSIQKISFPKLSSFVTSTGLSSYMSIISNVTSDNVILEFPSSVVNTVNSSRSELTRDSEITVSYTIVGV